VYRALTELMRYAAFLRAAASQAPEAFARFTRSFEGLTAEPPVQTPTVIAQD